MMPKLQDIVAEARRTTDKRMQRNRIAALGDHGFSVYSAVTAAPIEDVMALGFFDGLNFIEPWDRIELVADCEAEQPTFARLVVTGIEMVDGVMIRQPETYTRVRDTANKHGGRRHVHVAFAPAGRGSNHEHLHHARRRHQHLRPPVPAPGAGRD
jgi:hypothetical protein